jgi:hypothetical protein
VTDTTPTSNAGRFDRLEVTVDGVHFVRSSWGTWYGSDGSDVDQSWIDARVAPTSTAGHREPAKQNEHARLPIYGQGTYAHDKVTAQDAADHFAKNGTTYVVSGDQSLRAHGYLGMRRAGGPGRRLVGRSRFGELSRTMVASGRLPHPLTVDELTRLGLITQE